jgi:hypothetical protein
MNLATSNSPKASVVLPHYAFAAVAFFVATLMLFFSNDALIGHYFHPKLLAITHIAILGWAVMIIFGALYQLLPVVLKVSLHSEFLAKLTFVFLAVGSVLLATSFWIFEVGRLMQVGGGIVLISFIFFNYNIYRTTRKTSEWDIVADFITTSCIWLLITAGVGMTMVMNFQFPFLKDSHLEYLKLHAHLGIVGWFLLLIIGVASKLFPMFLLVHEVKQKLLNCAYFFINAGLLGFIVQQFFLKELPFQYLWILLIAAGIACFAYYCVDAYRNRVRKGLDNAMKQTRFAIIILMVPVICIVVLNSQFHLDDKLYLQIVLAYGFSIFFGFITAIILGQTFKTLPFIVWMHRYQKLVGKQKTPLPKDLYSEHLLLWQNVSYVAGFIILIVAIVLANKVLLYLGSLFLLLTSVFYLTNVFKVFTHLFLTEKVMNYGREGENLRIAERDH